MALRVAYMAHPSGGDPDNLIAAQQWLLWLIKVRPEFAWCVPWIPYCQVLSDGDPADRQRGIRDDLAILKRCDVIVLVGGAITKGMADEVEAAKGAELEIIDLTYLGKDAPRWT